MLQGSEMSIDNDVPCILLLVTRAMRVRMLHCELKREIPVERSVKMQVAACGMACGVCKIKEGCGGGCFPGTDPRVPKRLEQLKEDLGWTCDVLTCAMKKKVDYCLGCDSYPCGVLYRADVPYSKRVLDWYTLAVSLGEKEHMKWDGNTFIKIQE